MTSTTNTENKTSLAAAPLSEKNLGRRLFRNTTALMFGTNLNSLGRLITTGMVVRRLGTTVFGEYALILVWLTIAEWILDFGTTEVFVREANQNPEKHEHLVGILAALKVVQAPLAVLTLLIGMTAMQYDARVLAAGMLASLSLLFVAGVALCRPLFKAKLAMEREVVSDSLSVVVMIVSVLVVSRMGWGLMALMGAYVLSRSAFLVGCLALSRGELRFSLRGIRLADIKWGVRASFAIGVIGFVVVVYNAADLLTLSRLASVADVAVYSAAQRFIQPLLMALNAIALSLYPVLALLKSTDRFRETCQRAVDITVLLGCWAVVCLWCGAELFMSLLGKEVVYGGNILRILAVMCVIKAVTMVIGPVLFLVRAQNYALGYMVVALVVKIAVMVAVIPRFGYMGAAVGTLCVEAFFLAPVSLHYVRVFTGFAPSYWAIVRMSAIAIGVIWVVRTAITQGSIAAAAVAVVLYAVLALALRVVRISDLRLLLHRETA